MVNLTIDPITPRASPRLSEKADPLRLAAKKLEATFIAEMLKSAGFAKTRESFGGGPGEDGFASFLLQAQAEHISSSGGFGLAEKIYESLRKGAPHEQT